MLGNTYHLMLRPGAERVARLGGLHLFMSWPYPILTDSGGFQVMSLSALRKIDEDGVTFQSHIDGSTHRHDAGAVDRDPGPAGLRHPDAARRMRRSFRLRGGGREGHAAVAALGRALPEPPSGSSPARLCSASCRAAPCERLRIESATELVQLDLKGYAIGGLAVGEPQDVMLRMIETVEPHLPGEKPRYLMGVGTPDDIVESVRRGIDMFDCVMPTRAGRHGQAFTRFGRLNLNNARYAEDVCPLDPESTAVGLERLFQGLSPSPRAIERDSRR